MEIKERNYLLHLAKGLPHKAGTKTDDWDLVHPNLLRLLEFYVEFCMANGIDPLITRIIDTMIPGVSVSDSHNGRAFDASSRGWPKDLQEEFIDIGNRRFASIAAISAETGKPRAYLFHKGTGWHLHAQVRA